MFRVNNIEGIVYEDDYNQGEATEGVFKTLGLTFSEPDMKALLLKVCESLEIDIEDLMINEASDELIFEFCKLENSDGYKPTESEKELWRDGKAKMFSCTYSFQVERVETVDKEFYNEDCLAILQKESN